MYIWDTLRTDKGNPTPGNIYLVKVCVSVLPGLVDAVVPGGRGHDRRDGRNDQIPELLIIIVFFFVYPFFCRKNLYQWSIGVYIMQNAIVDKLSKKKYIDSLSISGNNVNTTPLTSS